MFLHPSAFVPPRGSLNLNASYLTQVGGRGETEWIPVSLTYGLTERSEVGALYFYHAGDRLMRHVHGGVFGKYQIAPDTPTRPAVAVAASYRGGDERQYVLAGVLSHAFTQNGRKIVTGHAGVQWAQPHVKPSQNNFGGFFGLEIPLGRQLRLVGEVGTKLRSERSTASAIGLMWSPRSGTHLAIGYVNTGQGKDNRFFIGIGYPIGGSR